MKGTVRSSRAGESGLTCVFVPAMFLSVELARARKAEGPHGE